MLIRLLATALICLPGTGLWSVDAEPPTDGGPPDWALGDPAADGVEGTRTDRVYAEFPLVVPPRPVVVAVIDAGVDIGHPDLAGMIWTNQAEADGRAGVDDDGDGHVDDVHGWNFLGSRDGTVNVTSSRLEVTREWARLSRLKAAGRLPAEQEATLVAIKQAYIAAKQQAVRRLTQGLDDAMTMESALATLRVAGLAGETVAAVTALAGADPEVSVAKRTALKHLRRGRTSAMLRDMVDHFTDVVAHHYDPDFDERAPIGDDPANPDERGYGNNQVHVPGQGDHGTHVAGIIAAVRGNGVGIDGHAAFARIMPIRAVPDGDERDKDVANAIRYAVDHGARIINLSFGKDWSPDKATVDDACRHAEARGVLMVHAAGNDGADVDRRPTHPNPVPIAPIAGGHRFANWLVVGASTRHRRTLAAAFSNYGSTAVDLFAPGDGIRSTIPEAAYDTSSGTSMAAPAVSGVAALVWSQYPDLPVRALATVLRITARRHPGLLVPAPGDDGKGRTPPVPFASLSATGGVIDAWAALDLLRQTLGPPRGIPYRTRSAEGQP